MEMSEIMIIKTVFGTMLTIGSMVLFFVTFKLWYKYIIQEKRCTEVTDGIVKAYTLASKGSGVHLPIVNYYVGGKEYKVVGPEYKMIKVVNKSSVIDKNGMNYQESGQSLIINRTSNSIAGVFENPMEEMYPINSHINVYYNPGHPKLAYVKRYCDKRWEFWLGFCGAVFCLLIDILIFILYCG